MPWNARAGLVLPVAIAAAVLLLGNCSTEQLGPNEPTGGTEPALLVEVGPAEIPPGGEPNELLSLSAGFTQGNDSSTEECHGGEKCVIQGQQATGNARVTCSAGVGNCGSPSFTWSMVNVPTGVSVAFNPPTTPIEDWIAITISADNSAATGTYQTAITSVPHFDGPDVSYPIRVMCSINLNTCPRIEIVDSMLNGAPVVTEESGDTTFIGKRMLLAARRKSGSGGGSYSDSLANIVWTLATGDSTIKSYDLANGQLQHFGAGDWAHSSVSFYYAITHDEYVVKVEADVTDNSNGTVTRPVARAKVNAQGPTLTSIDTTLTHQWDFVNNPLTTRCGLTF